MNNLIAPRLVGDLVQPIKDGLDGSLNLQGCIDHGSRALKGKKGNAGGDVLMVFDQALSPVGEIRASYRPLFTGPRQFPVLEEQGEGRCRESGVLVPSSLTTPLVVRSS